MCSAAPNTKTSPSAWCSGRREPVVTLYNTIAKRDARALLWVHGADGSTPANATRSLPREQSNDRETQTRPRGWKAPNTIHNLMKHTPNPADKLLLAIGCQPVHVDAPAFLFPAPSAAPVAGPSIGRKRRRRRARGRLRHEHSPNQ